MKIKPKTKEYFDIHRWLAKHYGKAPNCSSNECKGISKNYDWALKKGFEYERNIDNYIPLCKSCHFIYDYTEEVRERRKKTFAEGKRTMPKYRLGSPYKPVDMLTMDGEYLKSFPSIKSAGEGIGICRKIIQKSIEKNNKKAGGELRYSSGGYKWRFSIVSTAKGEGNE